MESMEQWVARGSTLFKCIGSLLTKSAWPILLQVVVHSPIRPNRVFSYCMNRIIRLRQVSREVGRLSVNDWFTSHYVGGNAGYCGDLKGGSRGGPQRRPSCHSSKASQKNLPKKKTVSARGAQEEDGSIKGYPIEKKREIH